MPRPRTTYRRSPSLMNISWDESDESSFFNLNSTTNQSKKITKRSLRTKRTSLAKKKNSSSVVTNMQKVFQNVPQLDSSYNMSADDDTEPNVRKPTVDTDDSEPEFSWTVKDIVKDSVGDAFYDLSPYDDDLLSIDTKSHTNKNLNIEQDSPAAANNAITRSSTFNIGHSNNPSAVNIDSTFEKQNNSGLEFLDSFLDDAAAAQTPKKQVESKADLNTLDQLMKEAADLLNNAASDIVDSKNTNNKKKTADTPQKTCPICFDAFDGSKQAIATVCGHIFCLPCIEQVIKSIKKCPTCRKPISSKSKYHPIYF